MAIDFNASLDKILGTYTTISQARAERDIAKYQAAASMQQAALNPPVGYTATGAYAIGNATVPGAAPAQYQQSYFDRIPKELLYGSVGLLGFALLLKAVK